MGSISDDFKRINDEDFYTNDNGEPAEAFTISGVFKSLNSKEAGIFLEWLSFNDEGNYELRLKFDVRKKVNDGNQFFTDTKLVAGDDSNGHPLTSRARSFLKATYLKALRNADDELTPGFRSHLPQMLMANSVFKDKENSEKQLVNILDEANKRIEGFFSENKKTTNISGFPEYESINNQLTGVLSKLYDKKDQSKSNTSFHLPQANLFQILKQLSLNPDNVNIGLGNMNLLFIATELALLNNHVQTTVFGPNIMLIEELEAHLHVQAQIRLIKYIENYLKNQSDEVNTQFILTSHSVEVTASIDQRCLIYMYGGNAYPMDETDTSLNNEDYNFLNRFLDATKCNLFFAKGLILVEGYAENILLPALAELMGYPLYDNGISIVNVGGRSFENYIKLFSRSNDKNSISLPIAVVRDSDIRPFTYRVNDDNYQNLLEKIANVDEINKQEMNKNFESFGKLIKAINVKYMSDNKKALINITRQLLNDSERKRLQEEKEEKQQNEFNVYNANSQTFVSPDWTLEFSLLHSPLRKLLVESAYEISYKKNNSDRQIEQFNKNYEKNSEETLISFFEWFEKNVSKSIVAQLLAEKILSLGNEDKIELKESLQENQYCKYLIDSVKYAANMNGE